MPKCDVCGKPSSVHLHDIRNGVKTSHSFCVDHAPPEIQATSWRSLDGVKSIEQMIAQLDAREMDPAEKAEYRRELQKLAEDISAGRKRFGDNEPST